jgi:hypothetical protein
MMNRIFPFLTVLIVTSTAFAQDAAADGQEFWHSIVAHLLEIVVVVATPLVLLLVRKLIQVLADKVGVEVEERYMVLADEWVGKGIAYAEEQAHKALKEGKEPVKGAEKQIMAVEFIADALEGTGLVNTGKDALAKLVEAKLQLERSPK